MYSQPAPPTPISSGQPDSSPSRPAHATTPHLRLRHSRRRSWRLFGDSTRQRSARQRRTFTEATQTAETADAADGNRARHRTCQVQAACRQGRLARSRAVVSQREVVELKVARRTPEQKRQPRWRRSSAPPTAIPLRPACSASPGPRARESSVRART